jgi:transposase InsO family protein
VEQKSAGRDLTKAATHAGGYFDALKETERPRFQLLCDFQTFELLDRDRREILNAEWFVTTKQAQTAINAWLKQYNNIRPHQALNMRPPVPETLLKNGI